MTPNQLAAIEARANTAMDDYREGTVKYVYQFVRDEVPVLIAEVRQLRYTLRWMAQTVHQAHHEGDIAECQKSTCRAALAKVKP